LARAARFGFCFLPAHCSASVAPCGHPSFKVYAKPVENTRSCACGIPLKDAVYIGPVKGDCNLRDAAVRANAPCRLGAGSNRLDRTRERTGC